MTSMQHGRDRKAPLYLHLSRRESQIMDAVFTLGEAAVADVVERLPDAPGYNTIRNTMATLERKGYLVHRQDGQRYLYAPRAPVDGAKHEAIVHLVDTFFDGSIPAALRSMLELPELELSDADADALANAVASARSGAR